MSWVFQKRYLYKSFRLIVGMADNVPVVEMSPVGIRIRISQWRTFLSEVKGNSRRRLRLIQVSQSYELESTLNTGV